MNTSDLAANVGGDHGKGKVKGTGKGKGKGKVQAEAEERYTYHVLDRSIPGTYHELSGSPIRVPSNKSTWPLDVLFDAVYAVTVAREFANLKELEKWASVFYGYGHDQPGTDEKRSAQQRSEREERDVKDRGEGSSRRGGVLDSLDIVLMCRFKAMGPEKTKKYLEEREEMAAARERQGLEEKVNSWRKEVI